MNDIFYDEYEQKYLTIPDGDIASHKQIHEYYEHKNNIMSLYADGEKICDIFENFGEKHIPRID